LQSDITQLQSYEDTLKSDIAAIQAEVNKNDNQESNGNEESNSGDEGNN